MDLYKTVEDYLDGLRLVKVNDSLKQRVIGLTDLTSLQDTDTEDSIALLCEKAHTMLGDVAAVCVYPQFLRMVAATFKGSDIRVGTVVNFPKGTDDLNLVLIDIGRALEDHAQEIDMVFPYSRFLAGEEEYCHEFIAACKAACGDKVILKVILETGLLKDMDKIEAASRLALLAGADFIKTGTGKIATGATLEDSAAMLLALKEFNNETNEERGFKVAGGIKDFAQAGQYLQLAENILGANWVNKNHFRIGSSKILDALKP